MVAWVCGAAAREVVPGEFIVKMKGRPSSVRSGQFLGKVASRASLKATFGKLNIHHLALQPGQNEQLFLQDIKNDPDVEYVEPNFIYHKADGVTTENRAYSLAEVQSLAAAAASTTTTSPTTGGATTTGATGASANNNGAVSAAGANYSQSHANTEIPQAWAAMSSASLDVPVVAVVDTGIDYNHAVFTSTGAIWTNPGEIPNNGIDDDGNGYVDDVIGWNFVDKTNTPFDDEEHGTHVSGIILGVTQNILATTLVPASIRIMPLKFLDSTGSGATSDAISAIYYAVNNGASVINNSWGGPDYSQGLHDALTYAYQHHVTIVSAAGNYGSDNDTNPLYPASLPIPSSISVAATDNYDALASFSNYGKQSVHMAAPGVAVMSTVPGNLFRYMSGTSMAAPFVAGLAALALREAPSLTGYQIGNMVINSGQNIAQLDGSILSGNRGDGYQLVIAAKAQGKATPLQPDYVASAPASADRAPATESTSKAGCGSVALIGKNFIRPNQPPPQTLMMILALSLLPLIVWQLLRRRTIENRRRFDRFVLNSEIRVRVGDRELVGQMNTISLGGASFHAADAMLENGGVVTLQIAGPDGQDQVQVEGRIVWNEANQAYGVQFEGAKLGALERIRSWSGGLRRI
ncbi:MAG: serine protease [Bdellovibrio sp.]|nr:MAG: serine protease [Bdellovibrio sp.]